MFSIFNCLVLSSPMPVGNPSSAVLPHLKNCKPGNPSLLPLLKSCRTVKDLNQVHSHIIRRGYDQDHFLITLFIALCTRILPTNLSYPTSLFLWVSTPNMYLWNTMMKAQCENVSLNDCFLFFRRMRRTSNVAPDEYTFTSLIKGCASNLALREGRVVHGVVLRCGNEADVFVGSSLIDFYGKCGEIDCACKLFDGMRIKDVVSWTGMMTCYLNLGDLGAVRHVFDKMPKRNVVAWNLLIKGLVKFGDLSGARKLFDMMPFQDEVSYTTLIDGYAKAGDMAAARSLFDKLPEKDLVSWSALISGYVQNGKPGAAVNVFSEILSANVKPDEFVMVSLMSACSQLGSLELAKWIESYMSNGSFDLKRPHVVAALVDMNAKCGNMERATFLFEDMPRRDLISFCSLIQGLSSHGSGAQAVQLFDRMLDEGIRPDAVAFTVILTACSYSGLVDDGCRYFDLMIREYSINPSPDHYACMVGILGKSGKLKAAYELIQSMPVESHAGAWGALLGACRLHCDIDLGEKVAHRLFEVEPRSAGNYVLLSHIYAEADRWLDIYHLRDKMRDKGVQKVPGYSYIELVTTA